ncbi:MAG: phytanoyl-CoA dioxygenase family protein [Deltaproteobacteria bacterium]|nr:phytanoyl-CoA dioxygenase family protein [Deltaproteobacteria bacterium]
MNADATPGAAPVRFAAAGFLAPLDALTAAEAATYWRRLAAHLTPGVGLDATLRNHPHLQLAWVADLAHHPAILDAVGALLGPDLLLWRSTFFVKLPHDPSDIAWHQDAVYWDLSDRRVVSAWLALTDSDADNGAVQVVPGSHRQVYAHALDRDVHNRLVRGPTVEPPADAPRVALTLRAGQFSLHDGWLLHRSPPNPSARPRAGLALRYIPTATRQRGLRSSARLVRGTDRFGHFDLEPRPRIDGDPLTRAWHRRALRRHGLQVVRQLLRRPSLDSLDLLVRLTLRRDLLRALLK